MYATPITLSRCRVFAEPMTSDRIDQRTVRNSAAVRRRLLPLRDRRRAYERGEQSPEE